MTQDSSRKKAVRARMARTGEKYTQASRALDAEQAGGQGPEPQLTLFTPDVVRTHDGTANHAEGMFSFLDRSAWPKSAAVREELERWFREFPSGKDKLDLRNRFRSPDGGQHVAAWWELYLHAMFTRLGYTVEVHPDIAGSRRHPDFLMTRNGSSFLMEAVTTVSGIVDDEDRAEHREAQFLDILESAPHRDFFLGVDIRTVGPNTPKRRAITVPLQRWLDGLDASFPAEGAHGMLRINEGGWDVVLTAHLRADRGEPDADTYMVGFGPSKVGMVDDSPKLTAALESKRSGYGRPDVPYVVAVYRDGLSPDDDDAMNALVGTLGVRYRVGGQPGEARLTRQADGLWLRGTETGHGEHVSAVLMADQIHTANFAHRWPVMWHNPWAVRPLADDLPFPVATIDPKNLDKPQHRRVATNPGAVLGWVDDQD